jgi:hypothetical protein
MKRPKKISTKEWDNGRKKGRRISYLSGKSAYLGYFDGVPHEKGNRSTYRPKLTTGVDSTRTKWTDREGPNMTQAILFSKAELIMADTVITYTDGKRYINVLIRKTWYLRDGGR